MIRNIIKHGLVVLLVSLTLTVGTQAITYSEQNKINQNVEAGQSSQTAGSTIKSSTSVPIKIGVLPVLPKELLKAGGCETAHSSSKKPIQFYADGTTVHHVNHNGTTDWGAFEINSIHDKEARSLGLDYIHSEKDNYLMALYIYKKQGIIAWQWSYDSMRGRCRWE